MKHFICNSDKHFLVLSARSTKQRGKDAYVCFVYIRRIDLVNNILKKELDEWQEATRDRIMSTASQVIQMNCKDELKKSVYHKSVYHREG